MLKKRVILSFLSVLVALPLLAQYDKDVFSFRGRNALAEGKYSQAIENLNILARLDTSDHWTFFYRGIAKYNLGDLRGSRQDFDRSVRLNPVFTYGYHYRGITESRFGNYDSALDDINRAIELRPGNDGLYYSRGVTHFLARQFQEAVEDFNLYIRREPKDPSAYLNRGAAYIFLGDTLKAFSDYNKAIRLDRFDAEGYVRRGRLHAECKDFEKAVADMNQAIQLDSANTFAYFNRALMYYEMRRYNEAMRDLDRVLKDEPGNALTLYNRSLINAQVGNFAEALEDMDRVININPKNVLAYFNRASFFIEMKRWRDALDDYDKAIELYPDFAKAYLNRSYVENKLGMTSRSKQDYELAHKKISEYRDKNNAGEASFADTTRKYSSLLALDADFAKKDFNDELLQHRDVDIRLKPLYRFTITEERRGAVSTLTQAYENKAAYRFMDASSIPLTITNTELRTTARIRGNIDNILRGDSAAGAGSNKISEDRIYFIRGMYELSQKRYNAALNLFDKAIEAARDGNAKENAAFYLINRAVLKAEMIDFIASISNNVQTLTMDDKGNTRARVSDKVNNDFDYSDALNDLQMAIETVPDFAYLHFNLGNLYCLASQLVNSIKSYDKAIELHPRMGEAFFNRGLVLIYLKDKEKGCIDLSRAGELGVADAYGVISKFCKKDEGNE